MRMVSAGSIGEADRMGLPEMKRFAFACMLVLGMASSKLASAACVEHENLAQSFKMLSADGRTEMRVRSVTAALKEVETIINGKPVTKMVYRDGLFPLTSVHERGTTTYDYPTEVSGFPLKIGQRLTYTYIARTPGQQDLLTVAEMAVVAEDKIDIGECSYPVVLIERTNRYAQANRPSTSSVVLGYFSPTLMVPLRTRTRFSNGQQQDFIVSRIEPHP